MGERGLIKRLGISLHAPAHVLDKLLTEHPEAEFVRLAINHSCAGPYAGDERLPLLGGEPCVRMLRHGRALFAVGLDNSQLGGGLPICHPSNVNNVLALDS